MIYPQDATLFSDRTRFNNPISFTGNNLPDALSSVNHVSARMLHLGSSLGRLSVGSKADLVLLMDGVHIAAVWINGKQVWPTLL
jgi:N-acetylglucosamine-6-phosphate deacetylase